MPAHSPPAVDIRTSQGPLHTLRSDPELSCVGPHNQNDVRAGGGCRKGLGASGNRCLAQGSARTGMYKTGLRFSGELGFPTAAGPAVQPLPLPSSLCKTRKLLLLGDLHPSCMQTAKKISTIRKYYSRPVGPQTFLPSPKSKRGCGGAFLS